MTYKYQTKSDWIKYYFQQSFFCLTMHTIHIMPQVYANIYTWVYFKICSFSFNLSQFHCSVLASSPFGLLLIACSILAILKVTRNLQDFVLRPKKKAQCKYFVDPICLIIYVLGSFLHLSLLHLNLCNLSSCISEARLSKVE